MDSRAQISQCACLNAQVDRRLHKTFVTSTSKSRNCISSLVAFVTMNTQLHRACLSSIPPPASSTTTVWRDPLSNTINTHVPPDVQPKPASNGNTSSPLPRQNAKVQPPRRLRSFKTRLVLCDIKGCLSFGEVGICLSWPYLVLTYVNLTGRVR